MALPTPRPLGLNHAHRSADIWWCRLCQTTHQASRKGAMIASDAKVAKLSAHFQMTPGRGQALTLILEPCRSKVDSRWEKPS
jgi:hypothetical protein